MVKTEILKIPSSNFSLDILERPAKIIRDGGLVAFPTETVYGLGASQNSLEAINTLCTLKNRPSNKHYTIHLADKKELYKHISSVPILAEKLIEIYWPGPLTIILETVSGNTLGFRLPADKIARELIRRAKTTVVASSANPSGCTPPVSAEEVFKFFNGKISLIVDNGETPLKESSTIVQFNKKSWTLLREGIISYTMIQKQIQPHILFVCTGNTCRSPMAEGLLKQMIGQKINIQVPQLEDHGYWIQSAGTSALNGDIANPHSQKAVLKYSVNLSDHKSKLVDHSLMEKADHIYVMTKNHYHGLLNNFPEFASQIHLLDVEGVSDPFGGNLEEYQKCARQIYQGIQKIIENLF